VPKEIILAIWGLESAYGANTGGYNVIESLATLAYDGRRPQVFREQLIAALLILEAGDIDAAAMRGSWAGAMGQTQFMPSRSAIYRRRR
jgi:membrane-bound lytic murein transglycosylase B